MIKTLDHLIIAVEDLDKAETDYAKVFGVDPVWRGEHKELGTTNSLFNFNNTYFELLSASGDGLGAMLVNHALEENGEGLIGMVLGTDDISKTANDLKNKSFLINEPSESVGTNFNSDQVRKWKNLFLPPDLTRGIFSFIIEHIHGELPKPDLSNSSVVSKLDHLVINTNDADGFIKIYKDVFNIRLALDKHIDHWDKRMLFFRLNKTTIEVVESKDDKEPNDSLWGLALKTADIDTTHKRLTEAGIEVTEVRDGRKPGTRVCTVKSHCLDVPTLIVGLVD